MNCGTKFWLIFDTIQETISIVIVSTIRDMVIYWEWSILKYTWFWNYAWCYHTLLWYEYAKPIVVIFAAEVIVLIFLIKCVIFFLHIPTMEYFYLSRKCYKISFLIFILEKIWYVIESGTEITTYFISIIWCTYQSNQYMRSFPFMVECYKFPLVDESLFWDILSFCQLQDSADNNNHFS